MPQQTSKGKTAIRNKTGKVEKSNRNNNKDKRSPDKCKKDNSFKKLIDSFNRLNAENATTATTTGASVKKKTVISTKQTGTRIFDTGTSNQGFGTESNKTPTAVRFFSGNNVIPISQHNQNGMDSTEIVQQFVIDKSKEKMSSPAIPSDSREDPQLQYHAENCKCRDKLSRRCHRCERPTCECKDPVLKLLNNPEKDPIFGQEGASYAKFGLGGCYTCHSIQVKISICVEDEWMPIHRKEFLKTNCQGNFSIKLPPFVTDLLVVVKLTINECDKRCLKQSETSTSNVPAQNCQNTDKKTECVCVRYVGSDSGYSVLSYLEGTELNLFQLCKSCCNHALHMSVVDLSGAKEQLGPCRTARAMAIVQLCIFESIIAITGAYKSLFGIVPITQKHGNIEVSVESAIIQTVYHALAYLYPSELDRCEGQLSAMLDILDTHNTDLNSGARSRGIDIGRQVANIVIANRQEDGSNYKEQKIGPPSISDSYVLSLDSGTWLPDPVSKSPIALGSQWAEQVKPFVLESASQFRSSPPPPLSSKQYAMAFNEVKSLGGDGITTPTIRSQDATEIGIFWAYDGATEIGTPPRLYNQIAMQLAVQMQLGAVEYARMLALINVGMADSALACWESKYFYKFWRPVTGIRRANDPQTKPQDKNPEISPDPSFIPLGAPASNSLGVNGTPPFPAYPSGHSCFAATVFEILRHIFHTDNVQFRFVSDEYNGKTKDNQGNVRPYRPRSFHSLSQAEEENGQSRIFLGIHWNFDKTEGITMGRKVGKYLMNRIYTTKLI